MIKQDCSICGKNDWQYMDEIRDQSYWYDRDYREEGEPVGFKVCKHCGYITYDYLESEKLRQIYDNQRPIMASGNIITGHMKNCYHHEFLFEFLTDKVTNDWTFLDVGCAQGAFLNYLHDEVDIDKSRLFGTEWSDAFAAFAVNEYGVNVTREIDESRRYDFISYYHVLEHVQYPDKELAKIKEILKPGGYIYLSVPTWLDILDESAGTPTVDFENLYHLNHINVFTETSFQNLLKNAGLKVIKTDKVMYCYTVLCQIDDAVKGPIEIEDWQKIASDIKKNKQAIDFLNAKEVDKAIEMWPKFPDAYIFKTMGKDYLKDFDAQEKVLLAGLAVLPDYYKLTSHIAKLYFQWDENTPGNKFYSNRVKASEKYLQKYEKSKPNNGEFYYFKGMIEWRHKKNYDKAVEYLKYCLQDNPMKFKELYDLIAAIWKEKGLQ